MEHISFIIFSCIALFLIGNLMYTAFAKVKLSRHGNKSYSFDVDDVTVSLEEDNKQ